MLKKKFTKKPIEKIVDKIIKKKKKKTSLKDVMTAIDKWSMENDVVFVGSFMSFKGGNDNIIEDQVIAFGRKEEIKIHLKAISEILDDEKEDFINW